MDINQVYYVRKDIITTEVKCYDLASRSHVTIGNLIEDGRGNWYVNDCNHRYPSRKVAATALLDGSWLQYMAPQMPSANHNQTPEENIMAKARKLAALANRPGTVEEGATAAAKLQEFLFRHNLTLWQVEGVQANEYINEILKLDTRSNTTTWRHNLLFGVANNNFCRAIKLPDGRMDIIGQKHNIVFVIWLYHYVEHELLYLADEAYDKYTDAGGTSDHRTWKDSFCMGGSDVIKERLKEQHRQHAETTALVVHQDAKLKEEVNRRYDNLRGVRVASASNSGAYRAGGNAARGLNLNRPLGGNGGNNSSTRLLK